MRRLVLTPKFKRAYRKVAARDTRLQKRTDPNTQEEILLLLDIGSHDEVY